MSRRPLALAALLPLVSACLGTPTPLAPQVRGSVGLPNSGVQTEATELPTRGPGFERFRPLGNAYFGQPELVQEVQRVAAELDSAWPGAPLVVGDLSGRDGGKIPRHNSHRSGRDIDILWFVTTPAGVPVKSPGFIHFGSDGLAIDPDTGTYYRLDIERAWALIRGFLESKTLHVQWMFMSRPLEARIIEYARARGEPDALLWRAETVMIEPKGSLSHDDHIHMRISCTPDTMVQGCAGGGPYWEWLPPIQSVELDESFLERLGKEDPWTDGAVPDSEVVVQSG